MPEILLLGASLSLKPRHGEVERRLVVVTTSRGDICAAQSQAKELG